MKAHLHHAALRSVERRTHRHGGGYALAAAVAVLGADDDPDVRTEPADTTAPVTSTATTTPGPRRDPSEVRPEVDEYVQGLPPELTRGTGIGMGDEGQPIVTIGLRADAVDVAEDMWERWGTDVRISLGHRSPSTSEPNGWRRGMLPRFEIEVPSGTR